MRRNVSNVPKLKNNKFPNSYAPSQPTIPEFLAKVQVQEPYLKEKWEGTLVTFPNQKKILLPPSLTQFQIRVVISSSNLQKRKEETLEMFLLK